MAKSSDLGKLGVTWAVLGVDYSHGSCGLFRSPLWTILVAFEDYSHGARAYCSLKPPPHRRAGVFEPVVFVFFHKSLDYSFFLFIFAIEIQVK
jgi:hypothetical protein